MLLDKLRQYADRLDLPPPMYQKAPIRWLIDLDQEGNLIGFVPTTAEGKKGKNDRGKEYEAPHVGRSSGVRAKLLADNDSRNSCTSAVLGTTARNVELLGVMERAGT